MKQVCIFDLDGTLIDTLDSLLLSVNSTLEELKLSHIIREQCRAFVGNGARYLMEQSIASVAPHFDETLIEYGMEVYTRIFAQYCKHEVKPYDGIVEVLKTLKDRGIRLAVLSNKPHEQTVEVVKHYFGTEYFEYVQGQKEDVPRKPDPRSIDYVRKQLGVEKEECIYIGDSEVDMQTGIGADVTTIGVSWGFRDRVILEKSKVSFIADTPEELLSYINSYEKDA